MFLRISSLLLLCAITVDSANYLLYNPMFGRSHTTFLGSLADVLVEGGHNVTIIGPVVDSTLGTYGTKKIIVVPQAPLVKEKMNDLLDMMHEVWRNQGAMQFLKLFSTLGEVMLDQCNATLKDEKMWEELRKQKFDVGFGEGLDMCGFIIFHKLGMKKTALALSVASMEGSFAITGNPSFPSYVPGAAASTIDVMSFTERTFNTIGVLIAKRVMPSIIEPFRGLAVTHFGEERFPSMMELMAECSFFFVNAEPLVEFPRPILHKIVDIGGISVSGGYKPLNATWSKIFDLRPRTVLISFGTVAKSYLMPQEYKDTIRETFRKFPDVTFIWKYEHPEDKISEGVPNIIESTFVPQNDFLYDRRLSLFITHGGQGSTTESTTAGVPLIVIPVMGGDQKRNAQVIRRIQTGVVLEKEQLKDGIALEAALREVLRNEKYLINARRVGETVRNKPFPAKDLFLKNMEFLAKYGPLRQLDHYGMKLNFFQYYLLDVFAFLALILISVLAIVFVFLRCIVRRIAQKFKPKQE